MKPRLEDRAAFRVVGLRERFEPGRVEGIPLLWDRFLARSGEIGGAVPGVHFGVCEGDCAAGRPGFHYTAGCEVRGSDPVPAGMAEVRVPAGRYAVFLHRGPIATFGQTLAFVWKEGIPAAGLRPTGAPDFEFYDDRFRGNEPDSVLEVWIPVER